MALPNLVTGKSTQCSPNTIRSRILLPEDCGCTNPDLSGYCSCTVRTGGHSLIGAIEVVAPGHLDLKVEARFEGVYRTWSQRNGSLNSCFDVTEGIFLQEVDGSKHCQSFRGASDDTQISQIPFSFTIPKTLIAPRSDLPPNMLQLYPSAKLGAFYRSYPTHQHFLRSSVLYRIVATIAATGSAPKAPSGQWQCVREIFITPTRPPDPPRYLDTCNKEFKVNDCVTLRRHFCSQSLGQLFISAQEPLPVNLSLPTPRASTFIPIELSFTPSIHLPPDMQFHNWTVVVKTRLRLRVFHSTERLETEPALDDSRKVNHLFSRVESVNEEIRHYHGLSWSIDHPESHQSWRTKLHVAVSVPKRLLPSFLAPNAALRYSMVLTISILELAKATASIMVPVQLYRSHLSNSAGVKGNQQYITYDELPGIPQELGSDGEDEFIGFSEHLQENLPEYRCTV